MLWKASLSAHVLWRRWAWLCLAAISVEGDKCPQCCPDSAFLQGEPFFLNTIAYNSNKIGIAACLSPPTFIFVCLHSRSFEAKPYRRRWFQRLTIGSFPKCPKVFLKVGMLNKWCKYSSSLWQPYSCCPSSSFFFLKLISSTKVWLFTPHHISRATVAVPLAYSIQRQHWLWGVMWFSGLGLAQKQKNSGYFWKTPAWKLPCQPSYRSKWGSELINFMSSNSIILTLLRILPTLIITLLGILNDLPIIVYDLISYLK